MGVSPHPSDYEQTSGPPGPQLLVPNQWSLENRLHKLCSLDASRNDDGSSSREDRSVQTTGPMWGTALKQAGTTQEFLMRNGNDGATGTWTWPWTLTQAPFLSQWWPATNAIDLAL
eukprot:3352226-Amphidinium_carterae.2